jgi:hypothetical protein
MRWLSSRQPEGVRFLVAGLVGFCAVGIAVMAGTLVAFFCEGTGYHVRVGALDRAIATLDNALAPGALATFASPTLAALKAKNNATLWPATDVSSVSIFAGVSIPALAVWSFALRARLGRAFKDDLRWSLVVLALLSLACTLGGNLPLRGWLYDYVYPTRFFRHSSMYRAYYLICLTCIALLGSRGLRRFLQEDCAGPGRRRMGLLTAGLLAAVIVVLAAICGTATARSPLFLLTTGLYLVLCWGGIAAVAFLALRGGFRPPLMNDRGGDGQSLDRAHLRPHRLVPLLLMALAAADAFGTRLLTARTITYDNSGALARWQGLDAGHSESFELAVAGRLPARVSGRKGQPPNNDQIITRTPSLTGYSTQVNSFYDQTVKDGVLAAMASGSERVWFAARALEAPWRQKCFRAFAARAQQLGTAPLVVQPAGNPDDDGVPPAVVTAAVAAMADLPACRPLSVQVERYGPEDLVMDVDAPGDGWLLLSDRWAPGWRARLDDDEVPVCCGNFVFRAIQVGAGRHHVEFVYATGLYRAVAAAGWGVLLLTALGSLVLRRRAARQLTERDVQS